MVYWVKKDIERLFESMAASNSFENISHFTFSGRYTPSECERKFNETAHKPWTEEEEKKLWRRKNLVFCSPWDASVQFLRPIKVLQQRLREMESELCTPLFTNLETEGGYGDTDDKDQQEFEKKDVELHDVIGLDTERYMLEVWMREGERGMLLLGPTGSGKKLLAKAVASQLGVEIIELTLPTRHSMWSNKLELYVKKKFASAVASAKIVLIDEESLHTLTEEIIKSSKSQKGLSLLACTRSVEHLHKKVLKLFPSRLFVDLPNAETRAKILKQILEEKEIQISEDVDIEIWSKVTYGFSYVDLKSLCEAAVSVQLVERDA